MQSLYGKLIDDWIAIVQRYGETELGFSFPEDTKGEEDVWLANRMSRAPSVRPRKVELSSVFECPAEVETGWEHLRARIERGEDLLPHLSRRIRKVEATDPMLNHWRINHFHLGIERDPRHPGLIKGTEEIVYASLVNDRFLALRIDDHGKWADKELLETLRRCWPDHPDFVSTMTLSKSYTDEEEATLRKANINVPTRLADGSHFMSFGEMLSGASGFGTVVATRMRGHMAGAARDLAVKRGAGNGSDDARLSADDDWSLHVDLPRIGERVALMNPAGAEFTVREVVEGWRS